MKNNLRKIMILAVTLCCLSGASCHSPYGGDNAAVETAYQRVIRTRTIRAGYVNYPPGTIVNAPPQTPSGIFPDLLVQIGKDTDVKVVFTEEVGWANLLEGLKTSRYDIVGGVWANPERGRLATTSIPVYYSGIGVWVRSNETRFSPDAAWASLNQPNISLGAIDGSTPSEIIHDQFTSAHLVSYPNLTTESQLFLDLTDHKIDAFFAEPTQGLLFLKSHPGSIKNIASAKPLRVFPDVFLMNANEFALKNMIDVAIFDLQSRGITDQLITKYEPIANSFYRPTQPYISQPAAK